jgi:soluble lytic murein transglycosylase-like protein
VNPQTISDVVVAVIDACNGDLETATEAMLCIMRILQVPQSQIENFYIDEIDFKADEAYDMTVQEFAERYAKYKVMRNAPLTQWMYTDEEEKKKEDKKSSGEIAKAVAKQSEKSITTIKGEDNKERKVVKVNMALVSDNLSKSASLYKDYVAKYSTSFSIEEPLIFAVIEQESSFNPEAKSWVPAYGLMQLVPKSGGFDAYRYVYKREWVPTMSYLYVPHQNIELGTAYLRILENMFKNVKDADCRRLCVIAGYNTGAGNVCRAFTGKTNIKGAVEYINKYSYEELYDYLTKKLSTDEARKYVSGVSSKREKYIKK